MEVFIEVIKLAAALVALATAIITFTSKTMGRMAARKTKRAANPLS